jgi:hypothetical protein
LSLIFAAVAGHKLDLQERERDDAVCLLHADLYRREEATALTGSASSWGKLPVICAADSGCVPAACAGRALCA